MKLFSIQESLKFGWTKTREHSGLVFQVMLTLFALQVAGAVVQNSIKGTPIGIAATIVLWAIGVWLSVGGFTIALKLAHGHATRYEDLFPPLKITWRFFVVSFISGLIVVLGLIALIIPGVYLALRYSMVRFVLLDSDGAHPHYVKDTLRKSSVLTQDTKWHLLGFFLVFALINILGAMLFLVGLLVTVPVTTIAYAHVYMKLKHRVEADAQK